MGYYGDEWNEERGMVSAKLEIIGGILVGELTSSEID